MQLNIVQKRSACKIPAISTWKPRLPIQAMPGKLTKTGLFRALQQFWLNAIPG